MIGLVIVWCILWTSSIYFFVICLFYGALLEGFCSPLLYADWFGKPWYTLIGRELAGWACRSHTGIEPLCLYSSQLPVAVKSLRSSMSRQTDTLTDFLQEVTTMQSLDHPNIIRLYGVVLTQPLKMVRCPYGSGCETVFLGATRRWLIFPSFR